MSPVISRGKAGKEADFAALRSLCGEIEDYLRLAKHSIDAEIRNYPTPIPRCDAQFNHLYQQQAELAQALGRMAELAANFFAREDCIETIEAFIGPAPYADDAAGMALRARLKAALPGLKTTPELTAAGRRSLSPRVRP